MSEVQGFPEVGHVEDVAARVASALRRRGGVGHRINSDLMRLGSAEATALWLGPTPAWAKTMERHFCSGQEEAAADRQARMKEGGDEEAWVRASAGAAMLFVSGIYGEPSMREDKVGYSLENAVANLLHVADKVGIDPFQVLAGGLDRYGDTLETEADDED